MAKLTCAGESIPVVRLALAKERCARTPPLNVNNPQAIAAWVTKQYGCSPQENFVALFFDARMNIIAAQEVSLGALDATMMDPRVIFSAALLAGATAMMVAHNHPSGNPEPSEQDIALTHQLSKGATILGIKLLDHLVIARGGDYASFMLRRLGPWA